MKFKKMKWKNEHIAQVIYPLFNSHHHFLAWESVSSCFVWNLFLAFVLTLGGS